MRNDTIIVPNLGGEQYAAPSLKTVTSPENEIVSRFSENSGHTSS